MTFPTAAAMITRRKSLGTSTGPTAAIAIYLLPIAWLYRFIASSLRGTRMYWTAPQRMRPHPSQLFSN
jgi:hypothetical protein